MSSPPKDWIYGANTFVLFFCTLASKNSVQELASTSCSRILGSQPGANWDWTTNLQVSRWPALPAELQPPRYIESYRGGCAGVFQIIVLLHILSKLEIQGINWWLNIQATMVFAAKMFLLWNSVLWHLTFTQTFQKKVPLLSCHLFLNLYD